MARALQERRPAGSPRLEPIAIRAARARLGELVDRVSRGGYFLILRHSTPLAVLLPAPDYERLAELSRRDRELAAVLRGHGLRGDALVHRDGPRGGRSDPGGEMTDREQPWWEEAGEAPVPLVTQSLGMRRDDEPAELPAGTANEAERFLEVVTPLEHGARAGERAPSERVSFGRGESEVRNAVETVPGRALAALLIAACIGAFAHGWHVGSKRFGPGMQRPSTAVAHITPQHMVGR